jgi:cell division protein FtsA
LKERFGAAFEPLVPEGDVFDLPSTPGQGARNAQRRVLAHIMHMRLQEVLEYALDEITRGGYHQRLPAGVIVTGGGALAPGIVELAREVFAMPARCGVPGQRLRGLADSVEWQYRQVWCFTGPGRSQSAAGWVQVPGSHRRWRRCWLQ